MMAGSFAVSRIAKAGARHDRLPVSAEALSGPACHVTGAQLMPPTPESPAVGIYEATVENELVKTERIMPDYPMDIPAEYKWYEGCLYLVTGETMERDDLQYVVLRGIYRPTRIVRWFGILVDMDEGTKIEPIQKFGSNFSPIDRPQAARLLRSWKRWYLTREAIQVLAAVANDT